MDTMLIFLSGLLIGLILGAFIICCVVAGRNKND